MCFWFPFLICFYLFLKLLLLIFHFIITFIWSWTHTLILIVVFHGKKLLYDFPLPVVYWMPDAFIPLWKDTLIGESYMNCSGFFIWIGIDCLKHKTKVLFIFRFSQNIILESIDFDFIFAFSEHEMLLLIESKDLLFPSFDAKTTRISCGCNTAGIWWLWWLEVLLCEISYKRHYLLIIENSFFPTKGTYGLLILFWDKTLSPTFIFILVVFIELNPDRIFEET